MKRISVTDWKCSPMDMFKLADEFGFDMFQPHDIITDGNGFTYLCDDYPWYWILYWRIFIFMRRHDKNKTRLLNVGSNENTSHN